MAYHYQLTGIIQQIVDSLPPGLLNQLIISLGKIEDINHSASRFQILDTVVNVEVKELIGEMLDTWTKHYPDLSGDALSLALESASSAVEHSRQMQTIQLVWTGPVVHKVNLRRTETVLLELINSATSSLHIVSFSIYKAKAIIDALVRAVERGVSVSIYLETPEQSENVLRYDTKKQLGRRLLQEASIYAWATEKRVFVGRNKRGVLHAKAAVADSDRFFVTSANLTGDAMSINIELGVLIRNQIAAIKIEEQLRALVEQNIFIRIQE